MIDEILHLPLKVLRLNRKRDKHSVDHVVVEYEYFHIILGSGQRRRRGLLARMSDEYHNTEEYEQDGDQCPELPSADHLLPIHAIPHFHCGLLYLDLKRKSSKEKETARRQSL